MPQSRSKKSGLLSSWFGGDKKPKPEMLGTGGASETGEILKNRKRKICESAGGKYNKKTNSCD